jgi:pepF/M3 family oligoendopeptidase
MEIKLVRAYAGGTGNAKAKGQAKGGRKGRTAREGKRSARRQAAGSKSLTWDLDSIFPGGSASKQFEAFRAAVARDLERAKKMLAGLPKRPDRKGLTRWASFIVFFQDVGQRLGHADSFAYCLIAQNVNDTRAMTIYEQISAMGATWEAIKTGLEEFALGADDRTWRQLLADKRLHLARFYLDEMRSLARLRMEPKMEKLAAELAVNGYHAWNRLYTKIYGDLRAEFVEGSKKQSLSLGQLANKLSSPSRPIRKQAFDKISGAWRSTEDLAAMELNSLVGFRLSLYKERSWESPITEALQIGRVQRETIDAMWDAVANGRKRIAAYVAAKKRILGIDKFRWYDMIAPLGKIEKTYTYDEACKFILEHLTSFSADLGQFARMAIASRWVEAEDRPGKSGGGFCTGLAVAKQSRIFMTYSGNYNEMMTLAHELGHAYHSWVLKDYPHFARHYPMNLAETASTFNELVVTDAALEAVAGTKEMISLLDKKLQDTLVMFCDIRCRYIFDTAFHEERKKGPVPKERLCELMVEAQRAAFGDILAADGYHPLFWAAKLHFSESAVPFYNFPYTFGHLFAGGIYDRAKKEGPSFARAYRGLLADTPIMTTEGVAKKHLGVDLRKPKFWKDAVNRSLADVDTFIKLARAAK